jgi:mono/diheme cytochrome c family protein
MNFRYSRSHWSLVCAELLAVAALVGCNSLPGRPGPGPEVVRPDEVLAFNTLYKQNCSGCHGAEGKGGAAPSLADPVYLALVSDATLRQIMTNRVP